MGLVHAFRKNMTDEILVSIMKICSNNLTMTLYNQITTENTLTEIYDSFKFVSLSSIESLNESSGVTWRETRHLKHRRNPVFVILDWTCLETSLLTR